MRFLLVSICTAFVISSYGQTCTSSALMKKGTKLEYTVYRTDKKNEKLMKLLFEVADVKDSDGITYSTIIKNVIECSGW